MKKLNIIPKSLKNTFRSINNSKLLFILQFFVQLFFIILISIIFVMFATRIGNQAQAIIQTLQEPAPADGNPLTAMPDISRAADALINDIFLALLSSYLAYLIVNNINWLIADRITGKKTPVKDQFLKFAAIFIIFSVPALILTNIISKIFISARSANAFFTLALMIITITAYFMYISLALISKKSIKETLKKALRIGSGNILVFLATYIIIIALLAGSFYMIYLTLEANFLLLLLTIVIFIKMINFTRIYLIETIKSVS